MTTQQLIFQETIAGLKRALKRDEEGTWAPFVRSKSPLSHILLTSARFAASESDSSINRPTNRDTKRKRGARYVQQGQLDNSSGPRVYKRVWPISPLRLHFAY